MLSFIITVLYQYDIYTDIEIMIYYVSMFMQTLIMVIISYTSLDLYLCTLEFHNIKYL